MKVKIFQGTADIEDDVNEFLEDNPNIVIDRVLQSESFITWEASSYNDGGSGTSVTITIFYAETMEWDVINQMKKEN